MCEIPLDAIEECALIRSIYISCDVGAGSAISAMLASLKMNNRRKPHIPLSKSTLPYKPKPTTYNVPTVSEFKRKEIVDKILKRRRVVNSVAWWGAIVACLVLLAWLLF